MPTTDVIGTVSFNLRGWCSWQLGSDKPHVSKLPAVLRRRLTPIGRQAVHAAWDLSETPEARLVLSSRHGEFARTLSLLEAVASEEGVSPADFSLSVHNAIVGLLSIAHRNHRGHTAIAAGVESFCFALTEAAACLFEKPNEPVVLFHFDEPLPEPYAGFNKSGEQPFVLALSLTAANKNRAGFIQFDSLPLSLESPCSLSHALDFLHFLESGAVESSSVGPHRQWRWVRNAMD